MEFSRIELAPRAFKGLLLWESDTLFSPADAKAFNRTIYEDSLLIGTRIITPSFLSLFFLFFCMLYLIWITNEFGLDNFMWQIMHDQLTVRLNVTHEFYARNSLPFTAYSCKHAF